MTTDLRTIVADYLEELVKEAKKIEENHESELTPQLREYLSDLGKKIEILRIAVQDGVEIYKPKE